ncbi:MAG: 6-bladed beta-propeller [Tannerella sp.]|jgi:hypothetical protein|nr:6-bladed beta-propeller [Tannerella sp.]
MNLKIYLILLEALLICSCRNAQPLSDTVGHIIVEIANAEKTSFLSLMDEIEIIPLETVDASVFGRVHTLRTDSRHIFIADDQTGSVLIFDAAGKYVHSISSIGNGPHEYLRIDDMGIHPETGHIVIFDAMQRKLLEYTETGQCAAQNKLPFDGVFLKFSRLNNSRLVFDRTMPHTDKALQYSVFIFNEDFRCIAKLFPYDTPLSFSVSPRQPFQIMHSQLFYLPMFSQTVYRIGEDAECMPVYTYDFGKHNMDRAYFASYRFEDPIKLTNDLKNGQSIYFFNVSMSDSQLFADFKYGELSCFHIYDLEHKSQKLFCDAYLDDCGSTLVPLTSSGDKFVSLVTSEQLNDIIRMDSRFDSYKPDEYDNPALIKYKFKTLPE